MIKNGKPYTNEQGHTDYELIDDLLPDQRRELLEWIGEIISPSKYKNTRHSSYSLKHRFEKSDKGFYLTNNQFKDAMLTAGYSPVDQDALNWEYKIKVAEKSDDLDKLQRKLLPDQNEVLKNFVARNFPDIYIEQKSRATNSYHYLVAGAEWYLCVLKQQFVITIWDYDDYDNRKTIRLPRIKGIVGEQEKGMI